MEQYIPKSALVAEIDKRIKEGEDVFNEAPSLTIEGLLQGYRNSKELINSIEVKEVDLEEYYHKFLQKEWFENSHVRTVSEMMAFTAKHFFELGLKAQKGEEL